MVRMVVASAAAAQGIRTKLRVKRRRERKPVDRVHRRLRHYRPATEFLQREHCPRVRRSRQLCCCKRNANSALTSVGPPEPFHAVAAQRPTSQLGEGLCHIVVAEGRDLEEGHAVSLGVCLSLCHAHSPLEFQV